MTPKASLNRWLEAHIADVDALMLDIDGVLINDRQRLPGSKRHLDLLDRHGLPFILLTNDGNHSTREKADRLNGAGLAVTPEQIVSCGHAIRPAAESLHLAGKRFFVMGDTGSPCYVQTAGLEVTRDVTELQSCKGVVIGEEHYDWQPVINAVINYFIDHPDAPLIVPNPDDFYPGPVLKIHIGAGGVGRFIQNILKSYGTEINPIYLGKPHAAIFRLAQKALEQQTAGKLAPHRVLMIGDNMAADICGAQAMGYTTALMLTGVTPLDVLNNFGVAPDTVFKTF